MPSHEESLAAATKVAGRLASNETPISINRASPRARLIGGWKRGSVEVLVCNVLGQPARLSEGFVFFRPLGHTAEYVGLR